mmetsp:Transcript_9424/g.20061  ORF Transcript_9424/g.20061 Transcript_9424/m.20061 type:complete len:93 (+) Transcript_9424:365-643(+)
MIVATDTDDVDGSDDDDDDDDDDNDDDDDDNYDEGFSGGMNVIGIYGMNSRLIYDDYQGTTSPPVSELLVMLPGEEAILAILLSVKKQITCP